MTMPKSTLRVHEARDAHVLSARTDFYHLSDVPLRDDTGRLVKSSPWWIMNTLGQIVGDFAELVFDMVSQQHGSHHGFACDESESQGKSDKDSAVMFQRSSAMISARS